eukprot:2684321-Amphidinium_carterae.1
MAVAQGQKESGDKQGVSRSYAAGEGKCRFAPSSSTSDCYLGHAGPSTVSTNAMSALRKTGNEFRVGRYDNADVPQFAMWCANYAEQTGGLPLEDYEASPEQISALHSCGPWAQHCQDVAAAQLDPSRSMGKHGTFVVKLLRGQETTTANPQDVAYLPAGLRIRRLQLASLAVASEEDRFWGDTEVRKPELLLDNEEGVVPRKAGDRLARLSRTCGAAKRRARPPFSGMSLCSC